MQLGQPRTANSCIARNDVGIKEEEEEEEEDEVEEEIGDRR